MVCVPPNQLCGRNFLIKNFVNTPYKSKILVNLPYKLGHISFKKRALPPLPPFWTIFYQYSRPSHPLLQHRGEVSVGIIKQAEAEVVPSSSSVKSKLCLVKLLLEIKLMGGWVLKMKLMLTQLSN